MTEPNFDPQYEVLVAKVVIENAALIVSQQVEMMRLALARLQLVSDRMAEVVDDTDALTDKEAGE